MPLNANYAVNVVQNPIEMSEDPNSNIEYRVTGRLKFFNEG
jgi:hypothetical protein